MDVSHLLNELNQAQRAAVSGEPGNYLVLAGAGSGKTRVLVHRLAWLIEVVGVAPHSILAVTFTNKAASEMRARTESLLKFPSRGMWVGTFHGLAHRLLRMHYRDAGLPESFQILDSDDQLRLVKRVIREFNLDESRWPARRAQWYINDRKDEGQRPDSIEPGDDWVARQWLEIYAVYEVHCRRSGLVDFAELLLRAHELWLNCPDLLAHYQQRFGHLLVDEFQDTNAIQYAWIRVLAGETGQVFVVGDDDQSIYGWRGAKVEHIQKFARDFAAVTTVKLEQNYRSTATILKAANAIIAHNTQRLGKNLWTEDGEGELLQLFAAYNETEEASWVIDRIVDSMQQGRGASDSAILYRSNAQSRVFEEVLVNRSIPYRVYGGLRFFERAEIKDALAFLRLIANQADDAAFERVVNVPARGIGDRTVNIIRQRARSDDGSLWQAASDLVKEGNLAGRASKAINKFLELIQEMSQNTTDLDLSQRTRHVIDASQLIDHYQREPLDKQETRGENLDELVNAAATFVLPFEDEEAGLSLLSSFLSHAALEAGENQADEWQDCVQLMTLHSAKGLEFPLVFMVGMEQGLFPHQRVAEEDGRLEEERRLCYVGVTRAREVLHLCHAESRRWHGSIAFNQPSRFIREIPTELIHEVRSRTRVSQPRMSLPTGLGQAQSSGGWHLGQQVTHKTFGEGVIMGCEGQDAHARVQVNFETAGAKWLVLAYAGLRAKG